MNRLACLLAAVVCVVALPTFLVIQPFVSAVPSTAPVVSPERLRQHVAKLSGEFFPRSYEQLRRTEQTVRYIADEFRRAGAVVTFEEFEVEEGRYKNVVARFGAGNRGLLVIGAHYDSHADADSALVTRLGVTPATHTPGADDNASGVAALIELAHLLGKSQPKRPIELVAYALEEPPYFRTAHMGSAQHAQRLKRSGTPVSLMMSLEMVGYFSDEPGSQHYPVPGMAMFYPSEGNFLALVGRFGDFALMREIKALMAGASKLPLYSINSPSFVPGVDFSDHLNYWAEGIPALMVTDTAFMRNARYHTAEDTIETLDYARMAEVVRMVYAVAANY